MIGYFNAKKQSEDEYLLTNDMGFYKYVNSEHMINYAIIKSTKKMKIMRI